MIEVSKQQFQKFQSLIYQHSGIRLDDRKQTLLTSRLQRRLRTLQIDDIDHYFALVTRPDRRDELQAMLDVITTNETSFFRTQQHFDWFSDEFLGQIVAAEKKGEREKKLRIWSAACSIGAEPYTLVFCLHEQRSRLRDWEIEILASDLCLTSLATAKEAQYAKRLIDPLEQKLKKQYFLEIEGNLLHYEVRKEYRDKIDFFQHNLMQRLNLSPMDCIFLRNVLIYFDEASKRTVLGHIAETLVPGGYLVIGPSEGIYGLQTPLKKISTYLYQKVS